MHTYIKLCITLLLFNIQLPAEAGIIIIDDIIFEQQGQIGVLKKIDIRIVSTILANSEYTITVNTYNNGPSVSASGNSGTEFSESFNVREPGTIDITIGNETFTGLSGIGEEIMSDQQKAAQKKSTSLHFNNGLPFFFDAFAFESPSNPAVQQVRLTNTSNDQSFDFLALQLHRDLDPSFFSSTEFFSQNAIFSGELVDDLLSDRGILSLDTPLNSGITSAYIPSEIGSYALLLGTARLINNDGTFGNSIDFAMAALQDTPAFIPEPRAILLMILGIALFWGKNGPNKSRATH